MLLNSCFEFSGCLPNILGKTFAARNLINAIGFVFIVDSSSVLCLQIAMGLAVMHLRIYKIGVVAVTYERSFTIILREGIHYFFIQSNPNNEWRRILESIYSVKIDNSINRKEHLPNEYVPLLKDNN